MGTRIEFEQLDGNKATGYLAKPAAANSCGLIVVQEWWGVQDQITSICDRFAAAGYEALAPDLYEGNAVPYHDTAQARVRMNSLNYRQATQQVIAGAVKYLKESSKKVAITGFCLGGVITILGAAMVPTIDAAICFYGLPAADQFDPADIKIPVQGHFANIDNWCTPELVEDFERRLKHTGNTPEFYRYDARHSFMNEQETENHDRKSSDLAWSRTLNFLQTHLGAGGHHIS